ncbi:MAG: MBL fold metallo-hydrolase [Candidatus Bipolaricaulota bacterium]|nr:MBL fold metallo-hydrolase [Candidatus Bipolaricaulota bacterium]
MKITWIGHACFSIEAKEGRIVTDPFIAEVPYSFPAISADVVTVSHEHDDHNAVDRASGKPVAVRGVGTHRVKGLEITGIASSHDAPGATKRGPNTIFVLTLEGLRLAHLGDLGRPLDEAQRAALKGVQVLFLPVGGFYTIDATTAADVVRGLSDVRLVFPMHYRTERIADWPIAPVDAFLRTMDNARHIESSTVALTKATLPKALEVWVLEPA